MQDPCATSYYEYESEKCDVMTIDILTIIHVVPRSTELSTSKVVLQDFTTENITA